MNILDTIKRLKDSKGWSEAELAKRAGVRQSTISSMFRRNNVPTLPTLLALCSAFDITVSQFFSESNVPLDLTAEQTELLEKWNTISDDKKALLLQLLDKMR